MCINFVHGVDGLGEPIGSAVATAGSHLFEIRAIGGRVVTRACAMNDFVQVQLSQFLKIRPLAWMPPVSETQRLCHMSPECGRQTCRPAAGHMGRHTGAATGRRVVREAGRPTGGHAARRTDVPTGTRTGAIRQRHTVDFAEKKTVSLPNAPSFSYSDW